MDLAEAAGLQAVVDLVLDETGLPRSLAIDHMPEAIDDEECYEVDGLVVTD